MRVKRGQDVQLVESGHRNHRVRLTQFLPLQHRLDRRVSLNHRRVRQHLGEMLAPLPVDLNDLDADALLQQHGGKIVAVSSAADQKHVPDLLRHVSDAVQKDRQIPRGGRNEQPVALADHEIAVRRDRLSVAQRRADQHLTVRDLAQLIQRLVAERALLVHPDLDDFHQSVGEFFPFQEPRVAEQAVDFPRSLTLRVDRQRQGEHLSHRVGGLRVIRRTDPGDGMKVRVHAVRRQAAEQIDFILPRRCDQKIRRINARVPQHLHRRTVALNRHDVIPLNG